MINQVIICQNRGHLCHHALRRIDNSAIRAIFNLTSAETKSSFQPRKCKSHHQSARRDDPLGFTADKATQTHTAIFRLLGRVIVCFLSLQLLTALICAPCMHGMVDGRRTKTAWENNRTLLSRGTMRALACRKSNLPSCSRPRRAGLCGYSRCSPSSLGLGKEACRSGRCSRRIWGGFCAHSMQNSCIHIHE